MKAYHCRDAMVGSTERCTFDKCDDGLRLFGTNGVIKLVGTESSSQSVIASFSVRSSSPGKTLKLWRASVIHLCRSLCDSSCIVMPMLAGALKATSRDSKQRLHHSTWVLCTTRQAAFTLGLMYQHILSIGCENKISAVHGPPRKVP